VTELEHTFPADLPPIEPRPTTAPVVVPIINPASDQPSTVNHSLADERGLMIAWFVSLAAILLLASLALRATEYTQLYTLAAWLTAASGVVIIILVITWLVVRRRRLVWPKWMWRFIGLAAAGLFLTAAH
jgi:hypothetical protein